MLNEHIYSKRILQLLEKRFAGNASTQEMQELNAFMQQDELFAEAFAGADGTVLQHAKEIASDANERIADIIRPGKPLNKTYIYYGVLALILIFSLWYFRPQQDELNTEQKNNSLVVLDDKQKTNIANNNDDKLIEEENNSLQKEIIAEEKNSAHSNKKERNTQDDINNEKEPEENTVIANTDIDYDNDKKKKEEQEKENKQNLKTDNTANQVDYRTLPAAVRVQHVQIMSKINASESENSLRNNDVTNPNIGEPITKKKNNSSYNLEDMPYYLGNDAGFTSYVIRKLSGAVILPQNKIPSSVVVRFVVSSKGKIESSEVIGQAPPQLEKEILKVINEAPDWQPGKLSGKKGKLEYMIAIYFIN